MAGLVACTGGAALGQTCQGSVGFPFQAMTGPTNPFSQAADMGVAAGEQRIITTSNSGVRIFCKSGVPLADQAPLFGDDLQTTLFKQTPGFNSFKIFDPRIIYDGLTKRFWIVAAEGNFGGTFEGRIHIAVSTSDSPSTWGTGDWVKFTTNGTGGASAPSLNPADNTFSPHHFDPDHLPDRPSIKVDHTYLYISVRELKVSAPWHERTLMVVVKKADLLGGTVGMEWSQWLDETGTEKTLLHELAVDDDIESAGIPRVYMVTLPRLDTLGDPPGQQFSSIRLGCFSKYDTGGWTYQAINLALPQTPDDRRFRGTGLLAPGGPSDSNQTPWSLFFSARTRRIDGQRRIWAVHNVCPYDGSDTVSRLQAYQIRTNGWPGSGGPVPSPTFDLIKRLELSVGQGEQKVKIWAHDGAIGASDCGIMWIGLTRAAFQYPNDGPWTYPQFWRWIIRPNGNESTALVSAGTSVALGGDFWADFAGCAPDPVMSNRFFCHHMAPLSAGQWQSILQRETLLCAGPLMADFNVDDQVDAQDLEIFQKLAEADDPAADLDEDGKVTEHDWLLMLDQIGEPK